MKDFKIVTDSLEISLLDKEDKIGSIADHMFVTTDVDEEGRIVLLEVPMSIVNHIVCDGKEYRDLYEMMDDMGISLSDTADRIFCCGEGEDMSWVKQSKIDMALCPFCCESIDECEVNCHNTWIYRGEKDFGFDFSHMTYNHGVQTIIISLPGLAYPTAK